MTPSAKVTAFVALLVVLGYGLGWANGFDAAHACVASITYLQPPDGVRPPEKVDCAGGRLEVAPATEDGVLVECRCEAR